MNKAILEEKVQAYISKNLNADVNKIALSKSPFSQITAAELANQIAAKKKSERKLPTWFKQANIYFPATLSVEQTSSEEAAAYKQNVVCGNSLIDITAGFGVDSYYFAQKLKEVYSCEINASLSQISAHNALVLGATNITCLNTDGLAFLATTNKTFDNIYLDPARRSTSGKVFKLTDCTPNVIEHLDLLFSKSPRIIIKTSPLLDLQAGLTELKNVAEIYIVSVKNECKELLWVLKKDFLGEPTIFCATLNETTKVISFSINELKAKTASSKNAPKGYLYEPDVALMKSGAFDYIAEEFKLEKLAPQSHVYFANEIKPDFLGRIFKITEILSLGDLKKQRDLKGNVIVRNFPDKAENLVKKYKIGTSKEAFIIFTQNHQGFLAIKADIIQYY